MTMLVSSKTLPLADIHPLAMFGYSSQFATRPDTCPDDSTIAWRGLQIFDNHMRLPRTHASHNRP
jgi:hypothetical protein